MTFTSSRLSAKLVSQLANNMNGRIIIYTVSCLYLCATIVGSLPARRHPARRQVVQPTWLMRPDLRPKVPVAPVRVTQQNLQEAAALRSSIQQAVNEGRYVVATNPEQYQAALTQLGYNSGQLGRSAPMPVTPPLPTLPMFSGFRMPNATWWQPRAAFT